MNFVLLIQESKATESLLVLGFLLFILVIWAFFESPSKGNKKKSLLSEREREKIQIKFEKNLIEFRNTGLENADKILLDYKENKLETQLSKCNKCGGDYMRLWELEEFVLVIRCEFCKKKFRYIQDDLLEFSLVEFRNMIAKNSRRIRWARNNRLIRPNVIVLDNSGKKSNSPKFYSTIIKPKLDPNLKSKVTKTQEKEDKRSRRISQDVKDAVWNRDSGKCVECGSNENLEFDHIIPFSKGGANTYRNIQLLCEKCNRSKSDKIG